jgi:hypothetical protein
MKSSLRNVTSDTTSDPNLIRFRTFSHVTQVNPLEYRPDPLVALPSAEMDIIAPCKLMDRTHGVTEKFTQVSRCSSPISGCIWIGLHYFMTNCCI